MAEGRGAGQGIFDRVRIGHFSTIIQAREAAEKALAIDPDYAPAHAELGRIAMYGNDLAGAARHYERAIALDPTNLDVLRNAATLLGNLGRLDEELALNEAIVGFSDPPLYLPVRNELNSAIPVMEIG